MRALARATRLVILTVFAIFFVVPLVWLVLAPSKSDAALIGTSWYRFGSFHQIALAWRHLDAFSNHIFRKWIENSVVYALGATAIVLATAVQDAGIESVRIRSVLTCEWKRGVCIRCYGRNLATGDLVDAIAGYGDSIGTAEENLSGTVAEATRAQAQLEIVVRHGVFHRG